MVDVYGLWDSASAPPWSEVAAGLQNRLILLGGTQLETGGTDTHSTHAFSSTSVGNGGTSTTVDNFEHVNSAENQYISHTHGWVAPTQSAGNHLPAYKNFRLIHTAYASWNKVVPTGVIGFCETVPTGYARAESGESSFIRISTSYGGTGGGAHSHTGSGTLNDMSGSTTMVNYSAGGTYSITATHTHSWSYTSSTATPNYYFWSCGLIKASTGVVLATNTIWLFDGDPGSGWDAVSATGYYLKISSTNSIATGGAYTSWSQSHTISATSGTNTSALVCDPPYDYVATVIADGHTHAISATMSALSVTPSYVRLSLYKFTGFTKVMCIIC